MMPLANSLAEDNEVMPLANSQADDSEMMPLANSLAEDNKVMPLANSQADDGKMMLSANSTEPLRGHARRSSFDGPGENDQVSRTILAPCILFSLI
jgi:hypothetical protein